MKPSDRGRLHRTAAQAVLGAADVARCSHELVHQTVVDAFCSDA